MSRRNYFATLIIGVMALATTSACAGNVSMPLPEVSLPAFAPGGANVSRETMAGKVVYLDFWASWCSPCRSSFPWMDALSQKYKNKGLLIVGVNKDQEIADAKLFLDKHPVSFMLARDPQDNLAKTLGVMAMPTSFLIDRKGIVRSTHTGFRASDQEALEKEITTLLEQP